MSWFRWRNKKTDELLLWIITALACPLALPLLSDKEEDE